MRRDGRSRGGDERTKSILTDPLLTHSSKNGVCWAVLSGPRTKAQTRQSRLDKHAQLIAGERIRTADVQLGKLAFYH